MHYLAQELTLRDIELLLKAYRQAVQRKQRQFLKGMYSGVVDDAPEGDLVGRFSHCTCGNLRLADVRLVLEDLKTDNSARTQGK